MAELEAPATPESLRAMLREHLGLEFPRGPIVEGHSTPFDYLSFAFFGPGPDHVAGRAAPARDAVVWANRGGGKTVLGALATLLDLAFKPGIAVRILGGSLDQSRRMHAHLEAFFREEPFASMLAGRITRDRITLVNGSSCEVLAQSQTSVRGTRVQVLRCDEVELFDPDVWEAAQLTTRSTRCAGRWVRAGIECLSTMHLPYGLMFRVVKEAREGRRRLFRWGALDVLERCGPSLACRDDEGDCPLLPECAGRAKAIEAPGGHLTVRDAIDQKARVGRATWESEMLCLRPSRRDAVLPEFTRENHVQNPPENEGAGRARIAGMDFGFRSPMVALRAEVDPQGVLWIVDEWVRTETLLREAIAWLNDPAHGGPPDWVAVDPAGLQRHEQTGHSNVSEMQAAGLRVRAVRSGLAEGLMSLRARLAPASGAPARLRVAPRCARLIESLEGYHYPKDDPRSLVPVKDGHDHAVDALRYLVVALDRRRAAGLKHYAT
ncbi:MAG: hypothetical protein IT439_02750 [Phycisphaerales bacterium]|nr:hypothetical protein [Phycisphaerales bacterium]